MQAQDTPELSDRFHAIGLKDELRRIAAKELRETPEYRQARAERRARAWLEQEAWSLAEALYEQIQARKQDLDP